MKITLPQENRDIYVATQRKMIRQIVFCAIWIIVVSAFMIVYAYNYFQEAISTKAAIIIWIVVCIIPFCICKSWKWITDQSYEGRVISCRQTSYIQAKGVRLTTQIRMYTQNIQIRLKSGKVKKVKISWAFDESVPYYYEGDYIRYYRGTKYPQVISDKPEVPRICVMCGTSNLPSDTRCSICGKSLINHTK